MKLLTKTTLYFITISLFFGFFGGVGFYQLMRRMLEKGVNEELVSVMHDIIFKVDKKYNVEDLVRYSSENVEITEGAFKSKRGYEFKDTIVFDTFKKLYLPYRKVTFNINQNNKTYKVEVKKSLIETNNLIEYIAISMTFLIVAFILSMYFLNRYFFHRIWSDFFKTIAKIKSYDLNSTEDVEFTDSMIIEFNQLNSVLKKMIDRIHNDYSTLKEFTGNISHEVQTPLAIIKSKIETLLQSKDLSNAQIELIKDVYGGTNRLSNLNRTLILLTRIEHHQFPQTEKINIAKQIEFHLDNFSDAIEANEIKLRKNLERLLVLEMNPELADILLINLLKNAVFHNTTKGNIDIELTNQKLIVKNTGSKLEIPPDKLFDRFFKTSKSKGSLGLGLALVKKICEYYNFDIEYAYQDSLHTLSLKF